MGSAFQAGFSGGLGRAQERRERREVLEDEDRKNRFTELHDQLNLIRDKAAKMGKLDDPQTLAELTDVHKQMDHLYHPVNAPGALQRDWEFIKGVITRKKPEAAFVAPGAAVSATTTPAMPLEPTFPHASISAPATAPPKLTPYQRKLQVQQQKAEQEAKQYIAAGPLTPQQQAQIDAQSEQSKIDAGMAAFDRYRPDAGKEERERYLTELMTSVSGIKTPTTLGKWTTRPGTLNNVKTTLMYNDRDGAWSYMSGAPVPAELLATWVPDLAKPVRQVKLGDVPSKQSPTGYAELWGDPYTPGDQSKWSWTPIGATRYQQTITSTGYTKDPFGVVTQSGRTTGPANQQTVDLSGIGQKSEGYSGDDEIAAQVPAATTPAVPVTDPKKLMRDVPAQPVTTNPSAPVGTYDNPLPLDAHGNVPESAAMNPTVKGYVDRVLDGADIDKMGLSAKDKAAVQDAAEKYGWSPQGLFSPKEKLLLREADTYLKDFQNAKSLDVLGSYISRQKINNAIKAADGHGGFLNDQMVMTFGLTPEELDFVQRYLQVRGTVSGLSQLTRGGRTTEAGIKRLQSELPNPLFTHSAKDALMQLDRLRSEVKVAQQQGFIGDTAAGETPADPIDALDRAVSKLPLPTTQAPVAPAASVSGLKPGDTVWLTNADGSQTELRYKGGKKSDIKNYEEVTHAPASH